MAITLKKHIMVISQVFYPEQFRINDICTEWIKRGYKVTVITGIPNYPQGKFYDGYGFFKKRRENYNGIDIIRLPLIPRGSNSLQLVLNYFSFVFSGFFWSLFTNIKADYVFIHMTSPMTQALIGVWYAKKLKIPCYIYVQDLWPENVEMIAGIKNKWILGGIGKMVDYIYDHCEKIFTTSKSFVESIANRGVPKKKIIYWPQYAEDFYVPVPKKQVDEIPIDGTFNIIFTGNIGNAQGLEVLPQTAKILKSRGYGEKIRFNIVGDGRSKKNLMNEVKENEVSEMFNFVPRQLPQRIPELLSASDAAFLSFLDTPLFAMTIPAKLQSYMACGIPIIAAAYGESKKIVEEAQAGLCCPPGKPEMLSDIILKMYNMESTKLQQMGENARNYYKKHFDKQMLLRKMDEYFKNNSLMEEDLYVQK